jgi:malonyl-CoA O-methyltransferase
MLLPQTVVPPRQRIARAFGRRASSYDRHATVQTELTAELAHRLAASGLSGGVLVDLGCGTGMFEEAFVKNGLHGRIVGVDISFETLGVYRKKHARSPAALQADIGLLPFKDNSFDAAVTSSTLQWIDNLPGAFQHISAVLKNGGLLAFSAFVQGSFRELFALQQRFGVPTPVHCCETAAFVKLLEDTGFETIEYETIEKTVHAPSAAMALRSVSAIGGTANAAVRFLNRKEIAGLCAAYESEYRNENGVPVTYRAAVGVCRKGIQP